MATCRWQLYKKAKGDFDLLNKGVLPGLGGKSVLGDDVTLSWIKRRVMRDSKAKSDFAKDKMPDGIKMQAWAEHKGVAESLEVPHYFIRQSVDEKYFVQLAVRHS